MQGRSMRLVANARGDRELAFCSDGNAVGSMADLENPLRFEAARIDPCHAGGAAVGHQDHAVIRNNPGGFRKIRQSLEVPAGIVFDDLDAAAAGMRHENPAAHRIEGAVVERAAGGARYRNGGDFLQRHDHPALCFAVSSRHHV